MTGQMKKYRDSLEKTPEPVLLSQIQTKMDLRGLMHYAKEKGIPVMNVPVYGTEECHLLRNSLHFKEESVTLINDNTMT